MTGRPASQERPSDSRRALPSVANKVLVVDDDPAFHKLVEGVLTPAGLQCEALRSGEEALRAIGETAPLLLIIDGLLPGLRGDDVVLKLRERWTKEKLPVVFVSAFFRDLRSRTRLFQECQVDAVLHKPITPEELKRALARISSLSMAQTPVEALPESFELDLSTAAELLTDYLVIAQERMVALRAALAGLAGSDPKAALKSVRLEAHKFRGTGSSFGLPEVTRLGGEVEDFIEKHGEKALTPVNRAKLAGWVDALATKLARAGASVPSPGMVGAVRPLRVLLVDGPGELAVSCAEAVSKGLPVRLFTDVDEAILSAADEPADVIFVAGDRPGVDGFAAVERLHREGVGPVVLMATDHGFAARLRAQGVGARGYVHRLPDAASLLRVAPDFAASPRGVTALVLVDDRKEAESLAVTLASDGLAAVPCLDPRTLIDALDESDPALVYISAQLPGVNGLSLVRAVRADARHNQVPIIVLAASGERRERLEALDAGADDVLPPPHEPAELLARSRVLIRRRAHLMRTRPVMGLPGFMGPTELMQEIDRAVVLARRGRTLAVMVFDAELPVLARTKGRMESDAAVASLGARLKVVFRSSDVVASLGGGRFGVLLHDVTKTDAERLLQTHLMSFNSGGPLGDGLQVLVRAGLATFPEVVGGAQVLIDAATRGLHAL